MIGIMLNGPRIVRTEGNQGKVPSGPTCCRSAVGIFYALLQGLALEPEAWPSCTGPRPAISASFVDRPD